MGNGSLTGKTVLITGGAQRVGAAIGRAAARRRRQSRRSTTAIRRATRRRWPPSSTAPAPNPPPSSRPSCSTSPSCPRWWSSRCAALARLDVLVNNASTFYPDARSAKSRRRPGTICSAPISRCPLFLSQAAAPALRKSQGLIINIVDIHALRPLRDHTVYCAAKAGLHMLTRSLAKELGPEVRVNGIAPGPSCGPKARATRPRSARSSSARFSSDGHAGRHRAHRAVLCRERSVITGQILAVDGGRSVAW